MKNLIGKKFHRLTVISFSGARKGKYYWVCLCDCGKLKVVRRDQLITEKGATKSCGCLNKELAAVRIRKISTTHGMTIGVMAGGKPHKLYKIWLSMKHRCSPSKGGSRKYYYSKGIRVGSKWINSFENFMKDMGNSYFEGAQIDRIDNNKDYCKENCRWATVIEQANNKSTSHFLTFNGKKQTTANWGRETGLKAATIRRRIELGYTVERALTEPLKYKKQI